MITTREINVNLDKGRGKLQRVTTRDVDASIKVRPPKKPIKATGITTTTLADVADIAEKRRRDKIMAEKKAFEAKKELTPDEKKKLAMKEKMAKVRAAKGKKK